MANCEQTVRKFGLRRWATCRALWLWPAFPFLAAPLHFAQAQVKLSLSEAVNQALEGNPSLQASRERIVLAQGLRQQAGLIPNPRLILQTENTRPYSPFVFPRDTDNFAYLQQTVETGGKRERRIDAAAANLRRAELEQEVLRRQIAVRVKTAYWAASGAKTVERLLAQDVESFRRIVDYHETRVKEGAMAEVDLIRIRLENERLEISLNYATLEAERARINLFREMGKTDFPEVEFTEPLEPPPAPPVMAVEQALEERAELRLARHMVDQSKAALRLQQSNATPNVDVLFGYKRATGFDSMMGGLQIDLPFTNRNQGNIAAASAEVRVAESMLAATEALVRAEVLAAQRESNIRLRQLGGFFAQMRARADESARIAQAAYREGGADLLRLLDAERLRIETQLLYYRALTEYRQSIVALEAAFGMKP
ncbi:MAG: TolC family protein [Bryobacteraceae bacterium]|nr:TolC family protein [Bryobacteraceae bacterium]MDW8379325.1 TolC family protein [Bryobacterales bacterium]